jgi:tape measure domain-containing protein
MASVTYILKLRDQMSGVAKKAQTALNQTTAAAKRTADAFDIIGIAAGAAAVGGIFKMGAELEQTNLLFNTLTGSVEKGTKLFEDLTQFANTTPFSNQALNKNAQTLLSFGQKSEGVVDTLRMLGDVASGDQERLKSLTLAFAQSQSAGKLMGQDLLQFINAGFNPLQEIAEKTGVSMAELKEQMSKGAISAELVRKAFESATAEGGRFHGLTESMSGTMAGKWSTALGKTKFLIAELGLSMKGVFAPFVDGIIRAVDWLSKHRAAVFPVLKVLTMLTGIIIGVVSVIKVWIVVQRVINALLTNNPLGLIIVGIATLISVITVAWQESEKFRRVVLGTWEAIKEFGRSLFNVLMEPLRRVFKAFKFFGTAIKRLFKKDFKGAADEARKGFSVIATGTFEGDKAKARKAGFQLAEAYRRGAAKAKPNQTDIIAPNVPGVASEGGFLTLGADVKKLQAEGVVSGGIKQFNITISSLTGINTLSTSNIQEGGEAAGRAVLNEIFKALADIKNI